MLAQREKAGDARLRSLPSRIGSPVADSVLLTGYSDLWLVDVAGSGARLVANHATGGRWSPDRRQIAAWGRADTASTAAENLGLIVMNADGSGRRVLTTIPGGELTWSPDRRRIAFVGQRDLMPSGELVTDIYVVNASGGTPVNITRHQAGQRAFFPDWRPARPAP
jgi:Tol biopolymer transport system component